MLGKASDLRTWYLEPNGNEYISGAINQVLELLGEREIISIKYRKSQNEMISDSALIIYKEG